MAAALSAAAATGALLAACGSASQSTTAPQGSASHTTTAAPQSPAGHTTKTATTATNRRQRTATTTAAQARTTTGTTTRAANRPSTTTTHNHALSNCKARVEAQPNLSAATKRELDSICEAAASGNRADAKRLAAQICREFVESTVPPANRQRALAACPAP
jgi:hypothetical protein